MSLSTILSKITGNGVLTVGVAGAATTSYFLGLHSGLAIASLGTVILAITYIPKLSTTLTKLLNNFADVPAWPRFVLLGIATLIAAHHGGLHGAITTGFLLAAMDGNVFDALY